MAKQSAGLLPFRHVDGVLEVFLVHMGGPFWAAKDDGSWSLSKGEYEDGEDPLAAARREFHEETGCDALGEFIPLQSVRQKGGKTVTAWAFASTVDPARLRSNTFTMEWPRGSGRMQSFPEVDRAAWFPLAVARRKILPSQAPFLDRLRTAAGGAEDHPRR